MKVAARGGEGADAVERRSVQGGAMAKGGDDERRADRLALGEGQHGRRQTRGEAAARGRGGGRRGRSGGERMI